MESEKVKETLGRLHCKLLGDRKNEINPEEINCVGQVITLINELESENKRLNEIIKSYQQPASAHIVRNQRSHDKTLEFIKAVEQETLKRFTEYIKGKLSAIHKERISEKNGVDFERSLSLLLIAQAEVEKAKGEFLNGENNSG